MKKFKVLVFPCGSEIGLEIHRSLKYSAHIDLIGANSTNDHGRFVYDNYIGNVPDINSKDIISFLRKIVKTKKIDAIYPTMDLVIYKLKQKEKDLGCRVISSSAETTRICLSKKRTYHFFKNKIKTPQIFTSREINSFPVFLKPDVGYGSRGTYKINSLKELEVLTEQNDRNYLILEYLPNEEFTVDCFTDKNRNLLFVGPRIRNRIVNGVSVNAKPYEKDSKSFKKIAGIINEELVLRGAWFFQLKRDINNKLTLLEVASRMGGSSSLNRMMGVNFALLSVYDAFGVDVKIMTNNYSIELDRALSNRYKTDINYSTIYVDFDDCLVVNNKINKELISFLIYSLNNNKKIVLISKNKKILKNELKKYKIKFLFDEIIHINQEDKKYKYIKDLNSIFIDDSFTEREEVKSQLNIPVFSPDMVEIFN